MGNHSQPSGEHVTISYAGFNRPWASWIAHQLRARGLEATTQRWDPRVDVPFEDEFGALLAAEGRILLVLDNWYFTLGPIPEGDWQRVLEGMVPPHAGRLAAVTVATQAVPASVALLRPVDLHDLDEHEAVRRLLRRLSIDPARPAVPLPTGAPRFPNEPPEILDIPRRNRRFTGRDAELDRMHTLLAGSGEDTAATRLVLYGGTGTGKTQMAAEYAHRFGNDYDVVWWLDATHRANARERLAALAPRLGLPVGERIGERIRAVQDAMRSDERSRRWLLVFDGADDALQLADLLPDGHGHVLLTSTTRDWSAVPGIQEIGVRSFSRVESVAFVRRRAPRVTPGEADALASAVQDLPLLLAQTAAWLDANDLPVGEYIQQLHDTPQAAQIQTEATYPKGFQTAWSITLDTLRERHPKAAMLLKLLAFFSPNEIPVRLLTEVHYRDLHNDLEELVRDPRAWHLALRRLSEYTAVRLDYEQEPADNPVVEQAEMHRLYHRFLREELQPREGKLYAEMACQVLISADPRRPADTRDWPRYARLIPHLEFAGAFDSNRPAVQELVLNCVEYLRMRGEYTSALKLCDEVLAHWQRGLDPAHSALLSLYHKRGSILRQHGRYHEAEQLGRTVVRRLTADKPADHPDLLRAKEGLGSTLLALGQFTQARELFTEAATRFAEQFGTEAPQTLSARHNLGLALMLLGRYSEAREIHREVLQIRQRRLRSRHYLTLHSGAVYARLIRLLGDYPEAASRLEQIVRTLRQISDERHPQSIMADHQLGLCRRRSGDYDEARDRLASAAFRAAQVLGPQHPETLVAEADYATFQREHGDLGTALKYAESVAERYARLLGRDHPYSIGTRANVGMALGHAGEHDAALRHAESAYREMTAAVGRDHPWTLGCALNLSAARSRTYDVESAHELSHDTLVRAIRVLGPTHPLALSAKMALADDLRALGRARQAAGLEQDAVRRLADTLGPEHPHTRDAQRRVRPYWDFEPQPL
ncbi:FxSxx-COOH system tetratricopeptide repeat protein [Streptomyces sp. A012304]|uniref:FxSxx-COOH system tetratricopeptide repeat protein n=1 Tax=Streptomyces sp. A012304 TaxID=375446 RepID=UPI0022320F63|nr:FxSxx-COOH system tetratricopeptide repeat protein [Streptomyces sp. A012304]GKQ41551.1 ATP-binding protein [Streptomyces sp. A012304]